MLSNLLSMENYADPFITFDKKTRYYYFVASCQTNKLVISRSKKIEDILRSGESKVVYECGYGDTFGPMWAPEMYKIGDRYYIYTSCREEWDDDVFRYPKRLLILKSKTEDPFDGFEFGAKPDTSIFAIDPTIGFIDGKQYMCYSQVNNEGVQVLAIRRMSDPLTFTDEVAIIATPTFKWELAEGYDGNNAINEGAFFLKHNGKIYIVYSANGCWSDDYCLGVLEYIGSDICSPNSWMKHNKPLFVKGNGIYGVGHAAFFSSPDDKEIWCIYHCLLNSNPERKPVDRHVCIQKISFDSNDYPVMGLPVGVNVPIDAPSGE